MLRSKFVKFLIPILKRKVDSSPNFVSLFSFMKDDCFFSSNNIYFAKKEHIKTKIFETSKCLGQNSWNSSCQPWNDIQKVNSSSNFASFFIVMADNSSVDFKLILFQLWITGSHQNPNFETFKCSGENLTEEVLDVFWTCYARSIYVLCLRGSLLSSVYICKQGLSTRL